MRIDLVGKTALVTGASRGIGRAIAVAYAASGADVAVSARTADALADTVKAIESLGRKAIIVPADVRDRGEVAAMVTAAIEGLGVLDIVVNNAGGTSFMVPFESLRPDGWDKVFALNVTSIVSVCQEVAGHMLGRETGSIINVASVAAMHGVPALAPYGASKAAVVSLTKTLALEWAARGVRVNALCPGWTATDLNRTLWEDEATSATMTSVIPMGRWGTADEMTGAAVFLASDAASYVTGQSLLVDGGMTAGGRAG